MRKFYGAHSVVEHNGDFVIDGRQRRFPSSQPVKFVFQLLFLTFVFAFLNSSLKLGNRFLPLSALFLVGFVHPESFVSACLGESRW